MQIITGKTGENHVTAEDDGALHAAVFGTGNYVLDVGSKLEATVETSNNISIADGELLINGRHARIRHGETDSVVIENGTTGYNRIDLIVARYQKVSGIESVVLTVIKGETTAGTAIKPSHTEGNILEGVELAEMPLYAVKLEGVNIVSISPLFTILTHLSDVYRKIETYSRAEIDEISKELQTSINDVKKVMSDEIKSVADEIKDETSSKNASQDTMINNLKENVTTIVSSVNTVIDVINELHDKSLRPITL